MLGIRGNHLLPRMRQGQRLVGVARRREVVGDRLLAVVLVADHEEAQVRVVYLDHCRINSRDYSRNPQQEAWFTASLMAASVETYVPVGLAAVRERQQ